MGDMGVLRKRPKRPYVPSRLARNQRCWEQGGVSGMKVNDKVYLAQAGVRSFG
jgi:hypothetical protein